VCKELELAARDRREALADLLKPIEEEAEKVFTSILRHCGTGAQVEDPSAAGPVDTGGFVRELGRLEQPLEDLDLDGVSEVMNEIRGVGIPEEARAEFAELTDCIDNYEYDRAIELARGLLIRFGRE
jgi:hypothetical protein